MKTLRCIAAMLLVTVLGAQAETSTLVISTNNTPQDRKALDRLAGESFRRAGYELKLASNPSERSLQVANQGEVDGEGLRISGLASQYPNLIEVPESFIGISFVAFSKDALIKLDRGWDSLKPYRVAYINGWKMFESNATGARSVTKVDKPEQLFRMLDSGRIDLALYTRADGVALIRSMGLSSVAPVSPALKDVDMYLYLHRKHESAVPKVARALHEMKADGTYNKIMFELLTD